MYQKYLYTAIIAVFICISACQKTIHLSLRNAPPQYVIEGNVTDLAGPYTVQISQTTGFYESNSFPGVTGAAVKIWDDAGHSETLTDGGGGLYYTQSLQGVEGTTYHLSVVIAQKTFTANSTMPHRTNLDSLYISAADNGGKTVIVAVPSFTYPSVVGSYFFFNQTINGYLDKTLYYLDNDFTAGQRNTFSLERNDADSTLHTGDNVLVEMQCIDQAMYNYWSSMDESATGSGQAYPSNPVTNLSGGALGYFSAHTSQMMGCSVRK